MENKELIKENEDLRKQLIEQIDDNIKTLKEKDDLLDDLIAKNKRLVKLMRYVNIMYDALVRISIGDYHVDSSLLANEALDKVAKLGASTEEK